MVKLRARCLLVGDAAVGKSALCHMFHSDGTLFQKNYSMSNFTGDPRSTHTSCFVSSIGGSEVTGTSIINTAGFWKATRTGVLERWTCEDGRRRRRTGGREVAPTQTTGVELLMKCVNIPETNDSVELYIIDSAGKQTLVEACEKMWGEPSLLCLVFDLTSEQSFANCSHWMERVHAHCQGLHIPGVLVGNKVDLSARREVQASVAQEWAQSQGLEYHETSAKEMENCDAPLLSLARAFHSLYQERRENIQNLSPG